MVDPETGDDVEEVTPSYEGMVAYLEGLSEGDCPYKPGSPERSEWIFAYRKAAPIPRR